MPNKNPFEPVPMHMPLPRSSMPTSFTGEPIETIYDTVYKDTDTSKKNKKKPVAGQKGAAPGNLDKPAGTGGSPDCRALDRKQ